MILGDQGAGRLQARTIRGDPLRDIGSGAPGMSTYFANRNRTKRSIVLDLGVGVQVIHRVQGVAFTESTVSAFT